MVYRFIWGGVLMAGILLVRPASLDAQTSAAETELNAAVAKGAAALNQANFAEAILHYEKALRLAEQIKDKDYTSGILYYLANAHASAGQYAKAEPLYRRALEKYEAHGKDQAALADIRNNLAILYLNMGQYARAEPMYQQALRIRETQYGKDHPEVATSLSNLAVLYMQTNQPAKAEPLLRRSLQIREAKLGKDHIDVASTLTNLGILHNDAGQAAQAEPLHRRALEIFEAKLGPDHLLVAQSLHNLAAVHHSTGQFARAEPLYRRCLQIREAKLPADHPRIILTLGNLGDLQVIQGRWEQAAQYYDRTRRAVRQHITGVLPALSEAEQLTFLNVTDTPQLEKALSLGLLRRQEPGLTALSASWLLNAKAVAQQALADRALLERDVIDPEKRKLVRELQATRQQRASLTLGTPRPGGEAARLQQLRQLADQQRDLEVRLGQASGAPATDVLWMKLADVQRVLPADAVLVEIARFRVRDFQSKEKATDWQASRYVAWVIPAADRPPTVVDLGEAGRIDAAVSELRRALQRSPQLIRDKGEPEAEKLLGEPLAALARLVLHPLLPHVGDAEQLWFSPDADLWLTPWAALPLPDGKYLIEKHTIRYMVSGRDLVAPVPAVKTGRARVLADPDFDLKVETARAETQRLAPGSKLLGDVRGVSAGLTLPRVERLPGTLAEAQSIKPKLDRYVNEETWVYRDKSALEGILKTFRSPRILVLSTHGFFLPDQEADRKAGGSERLALTSDGKLMENPLLRCGLLLAGCNNRGQAKAGDEDGILTGLEIVGMDLRGTELVVLSACETGLGQVRNGEGVAGLRQAFQLAGARSVVATLWQIPDVETARLMSDFFGQLADSQSKAAALRAAQLTQIKARRDRNGAAHPFFWAAFTLTGQGR